MRKNLLVFAATVSALFIVQADSAKAATVHFNWSYTDGGSNTGSGTFTAETTIDPVAFLVTSISGVANGLTITGLDSYGFASQFLYYPAGSQLDGLGIGFTVSNNTAYNFYQDGGLYDPANPNDPPSPYACYSLYCLIGPGMPGTEGFNDTVVPIDFSATPAEVPLPAALPLLVGGLAGMGWLAHRRKRRQAAQD